MFILDCVATYEPRDERDAQSILERVTPRLAHANAAVVLSAVKVILSDSRAYNIPYLTYSTSTILSLPPYCLLPADMIMGHSPGHSVELDK